MKKPVSQDLDEENYLEKNKKKTVTNKKQPKKEHEKIDCSPVTKTFTIAKYQQDYLVDLVREEMARLNKSVSVSKIVRDVIDAHMEMKK